MARWKTILFLFTGFLAIALIGWWSMLRQEEHLRTNLLAEARMAAKAIDWRRIRVLTASEADLASQDYQRLKEQISAIHTANPQHRFIYLLGQRPDKSIFFFVDSEPPDSKDYSPPGQDYTEAPDSFMQVFATGHESVAGPVEDRWGKWISALVPVIDPQTGKLLALCGIDRDAGDWNRELALEVAEQMALFLMFVTPFAVFLFQRRRNQLKLIETRQYLSDIIQFYPDATMVIDSQGKVTAWNRAMEEFSGVNAEKMIGKGDYEYALPFYGERRPILVDLVTLPEEELEGRYAHIEKRDNTLTGEAYIQNTRGELLYFQGTAAALRNSGGEIIGAIESVRDITERKQMYEELQKAKNRAEEYALRLELTLEGSNDATWEWDLVTDRSFLNTRYYEMTEYSPGELDTKSSLFTKTIHPDDISGVEKLISEHLEGKSSIFSAQYRLITKYGHIKHVIGRGKVVRRDEDGRPAMMAGVVSDITEMKRLSDEINQIQNLESVGLLAGGLAHDFNNVLNIIYGNISFAKMLAGGETALIEPLTDAEEACEHAKELGIRLQAFSQGNAPVKEPIALPVIIEDIAKDLFRGSNILYVISTADNILPVKADPRQIRQVFTNLLNNAQEAISDEGTIKIDIDNNVVVGAMGLPLRSGVYLRIVVQDDGKGILDENLPNIFNPYFSTKDTYSQRGLGLGLSICLAIMKRHSGHITVESGLGAGAKVTVYLPAYVEET